MAGPADRRDPNHERRPCRRGCGDYETKASRTTAPSRATTHDVPLGLAERVALGLAEHKVRTPIVGFRVVAERSGVGTERGRSWRCRDALAARFGDDRDRSWLLPASPSEAHVVRHHLSGDGASKLRTMLTRLAKREPHDRVTIDR